MRIWILLTAFTVTGCANHPPPIYAKIGTGIKLGEALMYGYNQTIEAESSPISARIEIGQEVGNLSYGVSHHSQWLTGKPFDDEWEYHKTEIFLDYKFTSK